MRNIFAAQAISFVLSAPIPPIQPILPPPPIDLQKNIWFAHIHKAAGTSWIDEMKRLVARPCDDFPVCCKVRDNDERVIEESGGFQLEYHEPIVLFVHQKIHCLS